MTTGTGKNPPKKLWPWLIVASVLMIGIALIGPPFYVSLSPENTTTSQRLIPQVLMTALYILIVIALETGLLVLVIVVLIEPRVSHLNQVRDRSELQCEKWHPTLLWQWVGFSCLAFAVLMILIFVSEFIESFWGDTYWVNLMLSLPRFLPLLYAYGVWHRKIANQAEKHME